MDAIASAARVSKVTLYARYQKDSLFQAVVQDRLETWWTEEFKPNSKQGATLELRLKDRVRMLMTIGASIELRSFDRLLSTAPTHLAHALRQVRYNHMIDVITRDIDEFTCAEGNPTCDPRRVATELLALIAGWFRMESMVRAVSEQEAIAFGDRAVDLLMAARAVW
jgi:TetR/AcrR family transcriptional regulator, mexJK operon transcriptional repressor